jgi:hypothetical protein
MALLGAEIPQPSVRVVERNPHHQRVEVISLRRDEQGNALSETNSYVQLEAGLNYRNSKGEWEESRAEFESNNGWAVAYRGQHKVALYHNLNVDGAVVIHTPDGKRLRSHVFGLAYYDPVSGRSALIGAVKDSEARQTGDNEITYPDAFAGIAADVRYTNARWGFEQDVILWEQPPSPELFGFDPRTTRLELWTEFVEADNPSRTFRALNETTKARDEADQLVDEELSFGELGLGPGRSFMLGSEKDSLAFVAKNWVETADGGRFLVETVALSSVAPGVERLPGRGGGATLGRPRNGRLAAHYRLPTRGRTQASVSVEIPRRRLLAAKAPSTHPVGLVLDYLTVSTGLNGFTFAGDETYYVTGPVDLTGTTTFEGGSVIKYAAGGTASLRIRGPAEFQTTPHRPLIVTAAHDNSIGQVVLGGTPSFGAPWYAQTALDFDAAFSAVTYSVGNVTIRHARTAIAFNGGSGHRISGVQVSHCQTALQLSAASASLYNALVWFANAPNAGTAVISGSAPLNVDIQHLTADGTENFLAPSFVGTATVANSIFCGLTSLNWTIPPGSATHVRSIATSPTPFAPVDGARHYLLSGSGLRNAGTTVIDPQLKAELSERTTVGPVVLASAPATPLGLTAMRDGDIPDLGYHYPPVDYLCSGLSGPVSFTNGAVVAVKGTYGIAVPDSSSTSLQMTGLPERTAKFLPMCLIQENAEGTGGSVPTAHVQCVGNASFGRTAVLRFAEVIGAGRKQVFLSSSRAHEGARFTFRDCALFNLNYTISSDYQSVVAGAVLNVINTAVERCTIDLSKATVTYGQANYDSATTWSFYNSLFWKSRTTLRYDNGTAAGFQNPACLVRDCLFDGSTNQLTGTGVAFIQRGYNARYGGTDIGSPALVTTSPPDISLSALQYLPGQFGARYAAVAIPNLQDAGSRQASTAGLAQYTTGLNQNKDTGLVDIGLHYVAAYSYSAAGGFSGTQGANSWKYLFAEKEGVAPPSGNELGFDPAGGKWWNNPAWALPHGDHYTWIGPDYQATGLSKDSVRRFIAPRTGKAVVTGRITDIQQCTGHAVGVRARLVQNSIGMTWRTMADASGSTADMSAMLLLNAGDTLDFQLSNGVSPSCDTTSWNPVVSYASPADSDGDGLADYVEDANGDGQYLSGSETSPTLADSDGDGVPDGIETLRGRTSTQADITLQPLAPPQ